MRVLLPFLVALTLVVTSAASPTLGVPLTPDEKLIIPGVRVGKWTLEMTIDDLMRMNGPESGKTTYTGARLQREVIEFAWNSCDLAAWTYDNHKVELLVGGRLGIVPYKTARGVSSVGSTRADILKAYGQPTAEPATFSGQKRFLYDSIGIGFDVFGNDAIKKLYIFRPGDAHTIWTF